MKIVMAVIRREYLQRVRSKWFVFGTIAGPLLMAAIIGVPILLGLREEAQDRAIVIMDRTGVLYEGVASRLGESLDVERVEFSEGVTEQLESRIEGGEIAGYLVVDEGTLSAGRAVFRSSESPSTLRRVWIRQAVVESALEARLLDTSDADGVRALLDGGEVEYQNLDSDGPEEGERRAALVAGFVGAFMLYVTLIVYGIQVMRAVLEEKTTRIVEVIISVLRPWQLMLGKILGVGAVGLTQLGIWVLSGALLLSFGLPYLLALRPELVEVQDALEYLPQAGGLVLFLVFFLLGYFLFSSLYAAVAAMCSTEEEAQQTQIPVTLLVVAPMIVLPVIMEDPNGALGTGLSFVPFFSPILMFPRFMAGAPLWHVGVSLVLMAITVLAVAWVAGRIYRVGILMQGKRPTLPEIVRWVREA
jgi:ABC-2 type transport system permease protein